MAKGDHTFLIGGIRTLWRYCRLKGGAEGWTYDRTAASPRILIHSGLRKRRRLEVEIHEFLHMSYPNLSEEAVTEAGRELSTILWKLYDIREREKK